MGKLYEDIASVLVIAPVSVDSDAIAASDNDNGVSIKGASSVEFLMAVGAGVTLTQLTATIQYSSTGNASDASGSSDVWASSDAAFTAVDSDGVSELYICEVDLEQKGISDEAGKLFVAIAAATSGESINVCVIANVRGASAGRYPVTQENTAVLANASS